MPKIENAIKELNEYCSTLKTWTITRNRYPRNSYYITIDSYFCECFDMELDKAILKTIEGDRRHDAITSS